RRFRKIVYQLHEDCIVVENALVNGHLSRAPLLSLIIYIGDNMLPIRAPHGNSKQNLNSYIRTKPSVIMSAKVLLA
ncbi:unnamed protein product, partial [Didymodactylos carnosus]